MAQYILPLSDTMKANVNLILSKADSQSTPNKSSLGITSKPSYGLYRIECLFYGTNIVTQDRFEITPNQVNKLVIMQDFQSDYTDTISLDVALFPIQYLQLFDNSKGLKCLLKFYQRGTEAQSVAKAPLFVKEYLCIFKNKLDIRKRLPKGAITPDTQQQQSSEHYNNYIESVEFQLMERNIYRSRKRIFNFQLKDATVKDTVLFMCKLCNIPSIAMVEPDNTHVYTNMIIPPAMTFSEIMLFLQEHYGVYNKGLSYYVTDDILYVYPAYETTPSTPESVHLYYAGNNFMGNDVYHALADTITHVVLSNQITATVDPADADAENSGNAVIIQDATRVIDWASTISESQDINEGTMGLGKMNISELNTSMFMIKDDDVGIDVDQYTPKFKFDNANPYRIRTVLNRNRRSIVQCVWDSAVPFTFKPGYKILYHYDSEDEGARNQTATISRTGMYTTKRGICEAVQYTLAPISRVGNDDVFLCKGQIVASLEFDAKHESSNNTVIPSSATARNTKETSTDASALGKLLSRY